MTIKEARQAKGLSMRKAAVLIGVPYRTWQDWEAGLRKPPDYVERLIVEKLSNYSKIVRK